MVRHDVDALEAQQRVEVEGLDTGFAVHYFEWSEVAEFLVAVGDRILVRPVRHPDELWMVPLELAHVPFYIRIHTPYKRLSVLEKVRLNNVVANARSQTHN